MMLKGPDNAPTDTARAQNDTVRPSSTDRGIDTGELARVANQALVSRSERSRHRGERRRMGLHIYRQRRRALWSGAFRNIMGDPDAAFPCRVRSVFDDCTSASIRCVEANPGAARQSSPSSAAVQN
jgi:hypothetical protein